MPRLRIRRMMLDATDHRRLAEFYRRLLGAQYEGSEPGQDVEPRFIDLVEPTTGARLGFQVSENYQRPDWPDHGKAPTQGHLDISLQACELDQAIDFAVSLGACVTSVVERDEGGRCSPRPRGSSFLLPDRSSVRRVRRRLRDALEYGLGHGRSERSVMADAESEATGVE